MINLSGVLNRRHTTAIGAIVDEIIANQGNMVAMQLMPIKNTFAEYIEHEVVAGFGGMTKERVLGEKGKQIAGMSTDTKIFKPGSYQEFVRFDEKGLLRLRKAGTYGERGATGMTNDELDQITRAGRKLRRRIENRIQKLIWDAIFLGKFVYMGVEYLFGVPGTNTIATGTDWTDLDESTPYADLITILDQNAILRKYKIAKIVMNGTTSANILKSNATKTYITNANIKNASEKEVKNFVAPGLPPFEIVRDSYQSETVVDGKVTLGNAEFFVPDNKVLLVPDFSGTDYPQYGDFEMTENLNDPSATLDRPAVGSYVFADEKGLEDKQSPSMKVVGGFNGGPNLKRSKDVLILDATGGE